MADLIKDGQARVSACYAHSKYKISTYDDGFGPLWISRNSIGINGIVRAQTWEDAYSICEDEFFPEADESMEEIVKEYGFKREHVKITSLDGRLIRWETRETPDPDGWMENELFQDAFGFRNNGPNARDKHKHGIYQKDLNGDAMERLTPEMIEDLGIELEISSDENTENEE